MLRKRTTRAIDRATKGAVRRLILGAGASGSSRTSVCAKRACTDRAGERPGWRLCFGKAECVVCHSGNLLTDQRHHNIAAPQVGPGKGAEAPLDFGRFRETGHPNDRYGFRTPPLRNVALTGPWLHSGAYATLEDVVSHHLDPESGLRSHDPSQLPAALRSTYQRDEAIIEDVLANLDPRLASPPTLSSAEREDLVPFWVR